MDHNNSAANRNSKTSYRRASDRDAMLNMLSKRAIIDYGEHACASGDSAPIYVVIFDLDNFKMVNDSYGHIFGDEVLYAVTDIINNTIADNGMVGRIGGDEIMFVIRDIVEKEDLRPFLKTIRESVEARFKDRLGGISLTCSMGAAAYPLHGNSFSEVMGLADKMLYLAKEKGRNRYIIYTPEMHADLVKPADGKGLARNQFAKSFDKIGLLQDMLEDYILYGKGDKEVAFHRVGEAFSLKEILAVYDKGKTTFRWSLDKVGSFPEDSEWMELDDKFYSQFRGDARGDNLFIIDGPYDLHDDREIYREKFEARNIESALLYRLHFGDDPQGYLMFVKHGQRQKWSEYELLALSTIGKVFEIIIHKKAGT